MTLFKGTKGKLSFSSQKGTPSNCIIAQVWSDKKETYVATMNSTDNEQEANANAKLFASSKELAESLAEAIALLMQTTEFDVLEKYKIKVRELKKVIEKALT